MRIANLKKAVWGLMAFASTLVCVMDCYPLIPAVYGVYCLSSGHTIIFYIGLIIGMGYFISIPSICKYLFIIAVIYFGERLFVRKSSKNGCLTTAVVAACATAVMNLSVTFLGGPDTDEIVLSIAESLVVFSMAFALCRACEYLRALEHNENPVIAGLLPDREEAFATAVSGLSGIISTANVMAVKCTADKIPDESEKIQLEVTGRLCACCEGCSVCWTSGASISDSIKMLADAVRKRMKTEEIVQNRYVDGCPHYTRMVEAATEAFARIELNEAWYRRLTENRRVIAAQLDAMAELMDSWCRAEKCIDKKRRLRLSRVYVYTKEAGIQVENAHIYENARQQVCIKADVCTKIDGGIEISKYVQAVSRAMGVKLRQAQAESTLVVDLLEKLLEAGFSRESALKLMNSAMVISAGEESYSTVDFATIDMYTGELELAKTGAAPSFIKSGKKVSVIENESLPAGVDAAQESKHSKNTLQSGDFLVMVTDGVLEYLHVKDRQGKLMDIIAGVKSDNAGVMAQEILDRVLLDTGGYAMDDMTVVAIGIWEK